MTHFTYITDHLLRAWVQQWTCNFRIWADLMTGNYDGYALLEEDDPYQECYEWFWASISIDDTLPKEFLEHLYQTIEDIDSGKVKTYPMEDVLKMFEEGVEICYDKPEEYFFSSSSGNIREWGEYNNKDSSY